MSKKFFTTFFGDNYKKPINIVFNLLSTVIFILLFWFSDFTELKIMLGLIIAAKVFYRNFGLKVLLENGKWSRSVYQCHNALIEKYPKYSKELDNILDLFLNVESHSKKQIIDVLDEMQAVIKCLYYGKPSPYIVKVYYGDK